MAENQRYRKCLKNTQEKIKTYYLQGNNGREKNQDRIQWIKVSKCQKKKMLTRNSMASEAIQQN